MTLFTRRHALQKLVQLYGAVNILRAQTRRGASQTTLPPLDDPLYQPVNVMEFAAIAQKKMDPVAWDYLEGGSEEEATLRDNIAGYRKIIIRSKVLTGVGHIDTSLELFGQKLD